MKIRFWLTPAIILIGLTGCIGGGEKPVNLEAHPGIRIVESPKLAGPGPLTREQVSIGGIRIGDSRETVSSLLGVPDSIREGGGGTPFVHWHYEQLNAYIGFYRTSGTGPVGGVAEIAVSAPSTLKTDRNIGTGDSLSDLLEAYDDLVSTGGETDGIVNFWINGTREEEGFFVPQLHFVVDNGRITHFELTTNLTDPDKRD